VTLKITEESISTAAVIYTERDADSALIAILFFSAILISLAGVFTDMLIATHSTITPFISTTTIATSEGVHVAVHTLRTALVPFTGQVHAATLSFITELILRAVVGIEAAAWTTALILGIAVALFSTINISGALRTTSPLDTLQDALLNNTTIRFTGLLPTHLTAVGETAGVERDTAMRHRIALGGMPIDHLAVRIFKAISRDTLPFRTTPSLSRDTILISLAGRCAL